MKNKKLIKRGVTFFSIILFIGCASFLVYYLAIQPAISRHVNSKYRNMYYSSEQELHNSTYSSNEISSETSNEHTTISLKLDKSMKSGDKNRDGVLLKFSKLLDYNSDIKGWLKIPGTNIDYPVMQSFNGDDFYLSHNFEGSTDKNGCLYIDGHSNVSTPTKNIVIHGHNMDSTGMMFHQLPNYKDINFYKEHPVITFDSIYKESKWKVISFMRVSGVIKNNGSFNYMQSSFKKKTDFLDFLYQIETRSLYKCPVDINEKDSILMLSTCSYEFNDCRTVVVARALRKGESVNVDTSTASMNKNVVYPSIWYSKYGGEMPMCTSFKDAMAYNEIDWYDGKKKVDTAIGTTVESDNSTYKITSNETVMFLGCNNANVKDLFVPSTIKLGDRTFKVTEIEKHSFGNAPKLKTLKIGNNVVSIEPKTFINCNVLEDVIIGDSVKIIGEKAFFHLATLKKVKIRSLCLETIEPKAFKGVYEKAKFKLPKDNVKKYTKLLNQSGVSPKTKYTKFDSSNYLSLE